MAWLGTKRIAFIPVFRTVTLPDPPDVIPADWPGDILRRALNDPDPTTGADRSLRAYIRAASSGRADLEATVMPMVTVNRKDVRLDDADMQQLAQQLRDQGFHAAAITMLGGPGAGTGEEGGFLARFVMRERLGTWAMELMHVLTGFTDIRCRPGFTDCEGGLRDIGNFDEMAFNGGMHPTAYTKAAIQWLDASAIASHTGRIGAAMSFTRSASTSPHPPAGSRPSGSDPRSRTSWQRPGSRSISSSPPASWSPGFRARGSSSTGSRRPTRSDTRRTTTSRSTC